MPLAPALSLTSAELFADDHPLAFIARCTPQLRAAVEQQQAAMPQADFSAMIATIRSLFGKYTAKLAEFSPGVERGTVLHQLMDRELAAASACATSCHKGCSGCCHYEVEITNDEAAILAAAVQRGAAIDHERLTLQAARPRQSPEWRRFFQANNRCVFLGPDGACQVYDERPSICRKHMVTTPSTACTAEGAAVAPVRILLAEILLSASLSLAETTIGSLSKMLASALPGPAVLRVELVKPGVPPPLGHSTGPA